MTKEDREIQQLRKRLERLQAAKRKRNRKVDVPLTKKKKRGRPAIEKTKLELAKAVAGDHPIEDVAFVLDVSRRTLNKYGIKRGRLETAMVAAK